MEREHLDLNTLDRYLAGEATQDECVQVDTWVSDASNLAKLQSMRSVLPGSQGQWIEPNVDSAWENFVKVGEFDRSSRIDDQRDGYSRWSMRRWAVGVGVLSSLVVFCMFAVKYFPTTSAPQTKTYSTVSGQRATITLSDGSTMLLAPATRAEVSVSKGVRTIKLRGQAYFAVTHDVSRSFVVNTDVGTVRVLGTRFTVRQYQNEATMRVAVREGRVMASSTVLSAGDAATVSNVGTTINHDDTSINAWTEGRLVFRNVPIREVLDELERWYDIQINLRDPQLATRRVTAILSDAAFTDETLRALSIAFNSRALRNGRVITFTGTTP